MIDFLYSWIEASWAVSSVIVKFALAIFLGYELFQSNSLEKIREDLLYYSRYFVGFIVLISLIVSVAGFQVSPLFPIVGEVTALVFYGYLFWKY